MDTINWANYSFDEFELFCSALLTFEIGKSYQPFSAPGRDGGIDGSYTGPYQQQSGKWRFQFKFHQVARSQGVSSLRSQMKKEAEKLGDENFFVLLTNVELLPQEHTSLIDTFQNEAQLLGKSCTCFVWDGAKLYNLFLQYPILSLWLNEGFKTAQIQDYRNVFSKNLFAQELSPGSFSNLFISRKTDLEKLTGFLGSEQTIALIIGEAGIGKTRLVLEFFKQCVDVLDDWIPLVLLNRHVDFDKIRKALTSKYNYVILIDDAHNYSSEVIADMKALAESLNSSVKIILTARTLEAFNSLTLIKEYEAANFPKIKLDELSRPDTEVLFRHYITSQHYLHFINELVQLSFGKPIMIIAMLNAMRENIPISEIKEHDFLKSYVKNYFNSYVQTVSKLTGVNHSSVQRILQTVSLIEPFNFNDSNIINKIADLHETKPQNISDALKLLIDKGFVNGRYEQSIKPDYYSDIILSEIDYNEVIKYITDFAAHIDNIVINLSSVDEINSKQNDVLREILSIYTALIETAQSIDVIKKILGTVLSISFIQQEISKQAITYFTKSIANENHVIYTDYIENEKYNYQSGDEPINRVISILSNLYMYPVNLDFVVSNSMKLYNVTANKKLANIFSFSKRDAIESFAMTRQQYLLSELNRRAKKLTNKELEFSLLCVSSLLNLDFTISEWNAVNQDAFNITTYYLPSSGPVKKLRKSIVDFLFQIYSLPNADGLRSEILKSILDVPRGIFASSRNKSVYRNDTEIKQVLGFLNEKAADFSIIDQKEVLEKLYWFEKWGMPESMSSLVDVVRSALKPKNLTERISQLFSKAETSILEMPDVENYVAGKAAEFVNIANEDELAESIISFLEPQQYPPHYYWAFQNALENNYPNYAKALNNKMFERSFALYNLYGYRILSTMYFKHNDHTYYWEWVKKLQQLKTPEADNILLAVYGQRVPGETELTDQDIEVILKVFNKKKKENNFMLATALQSLFVVKDPLTMDYCRDFLARAGQREVGMFFIRLSDNVLVTEAQMADLILNHTVHFALTYEIERCLNLVLKTNGPDDVFNYLLRRYQFKKQIVISRRTLSGYEFVPDGRHSHLFDQCGPEIKLEMFFKAIEWYLIEDNVGGHLYYAKDLLEYLQPGDALNNEVSSFYETKLQDMDSNGEKLLRLIETLSIFHVKDITLMDLVVKLYDLVQESNNNNPELYQKLRTQCYIAITTMGVKSGAANEPFQVDLDLRDLIESYIKGLPEYYPVNQFLRDVLKSVNNEINRSIDRDNSTW
ncbi:hypothetical protein ACTHQF_09165 [Pedobacter sp. SAFR-022]|uniref:hypothetical protein n=1 Tax=Pedobacter sp. SAFR-022 TaxID=3436861 RepID=UPI003F821B15